MRTLNGAGVTSFMTSLVVPARSRCSVVRPASLARPASHSTSRPASAICDSGTAPAATTAALIGEVQVPLGAACLRVGSVMVMA